MVKLATPEPPVNAVPPLETEYQSIVIPVEKLAVKVTVPVPHLVTLFATGVAGSGFIFALSDFRETEIQPVVVFLDCV